MSANKYTASDVVFVEKPKASRFVDMGGQVWSRLTVLGYAGLGASGHAHWWCKCECGSITKTAGVALRKGNSNSCGCYQKEAVAKAQFRHGLKGTKVWRAHNNAKSRCENPRNSDFHNYGGRNIQYKFKSAKELYDEIGHAPSDEYSIDRISNDGNYEIGNVRWTDRTTQNRNTRSVKSVTIGGVTKSAPDWAEEFGTSGVYLARMDLQWCDECALKMPVSSGVSCSHRKEGKPRTRTVYKRIRAGWCESCAQSVPPFGRKCPHREAA